MDICIVEVVKDLYLFQSGCQKDITTFPHFVSPMPLWVLVTKRSCASDTPMTSAILKLSVFACFNKATNSEFASMVIGLSSVPKSRIP